MNNDEKISEIDVKNENDDENDDENENENNNMKNIQTYLIRLVNKYVNTIYLSEIFTTIVGMNAIVLIIVLFSDLNPDIIPFEIVPIKFEKKISPTSSYSLFSDDNDEKSYKKNVRIIPDKILKKYCKLFSIDEKESIKLRLLLQDFIIKQQRKASAVVEMWSSLYPSKTIIFISLLAPNR